MIQPFVRADFSYLLNISSGPISSHLLMGLSINMNLSRGRSYSSQITKEVALACDRTTIFSSPEHRRQPLRHISNEQGYALYTPHVKLFTCTFGKTKLPGRQKLFAFVSFEWDREGRRSNKGIFWEGSLFPNSSSLYIEPQAPHEF